LINGDKFDEHIFVKNPLLYKLKVHFYMFGARMIDWIRGYGKSRYIITPEQWRVREVNAKIF
jgi:hypothetical protein